MKDALLLLLFAGLGFPLGAALARFILWMGRQKRPPRHRPTAALPGGIALWGIGLNLPFAALNAARHDWHRAEELLAAVAFYVLAACGAWTVTRRVQAVPSDRATYGDDI